MKTVSILKKNRECRMLLVLFLLCIIISIRNPAFLRTKNMFDLLRSNAIFGIMAFGMLPFMLTGGIDLSVSSTICLTAVLQAYYLQNTTQHSVLLVFGICIAAGALVGLVNGILVVSLKIPSVIATLCTQIMIFSGVMYVTGGALMPGLSARLKAFGEFRLFNIPAESAPTGIYTQVLMLAACGIVTWLIVQKSPAARGISAVRLNAGSAESSGRHVGLIILLCCIYCGVMAGIASIASVSMVNAVAPDSFAGFEMNVIVILVIGGACQAKNVRPFWGTVLGILIFAVVRNGMVLLYVPENMRQVIWGLCVLVTLAADMIPGSVLGICPATEPAPGQAGSEETTEPAPERAGKEEAAGPAPERAGKDEAAMPALDRAGERESAESARKRKTEKTAAVRKKKAAAPAPKPSLPAWAAAVDLDDAEEEDDDTI